MDIVWCLNSAIWLFILFVVIVLNEKIVSVVGSNKLFFFRCGRKKVFWGKVTAPINDLIPGVIYK